MPHCKIPDLQIKGLYAGQYSIKFKPFEGQSFFQRALVFSGQGAALPGMFKNELEYYSEFISFFKEADLLAAQHDLPPISHYISHPEKISDDLMPMIRSLCLFTCQVSIFHGFKNSKTPVNFLTSHSFGEYGALVSAGIVNFADMFDIIVLREKSCPPANQLGYMIAVNAPLATIQGKVSQNLFYVSNINSPNQVTISTTASNLEPLKAALKAARLGHKVLADVAQPYHTPLMEPIREIIQKHLDTASYVFSPPQVPLFSSVLKKLISSDNFDPEEIKKSIAEQIVESVDFPTQIQNLYALGSINFVELSAQQICSLFIRDILVGQKVKITQLKIYLYDYVTGRAAVKKTQITEKDSKFLKAINGVVGAVTGYRVTDLSVYDNFQEDLGVDSIKKAEIFFKVIEEIGISEKELRLDPNFVISEMKTIADIVDFVNKRNSAPANLAPTAAPTLAPENKMDFLRYTPTWVKTESGTINYDYDLKPDYLWLQIDDIIKGEPQVLAQTSAFLNQAGPDQRKILAIKIPKKSGLNSLGFLHQVQNEYSQVIKPFILFFKGLLAGLQELPKVQRNIFIVSELSDNPTINAFESFLKSLVKEDRRFSFKVIYTAQSLSTKKMETLLLTETRRPFDFDILYSEGHRHVRSFKKIDDSPKSMPLNSASVLVAIGGGKGITFALLSKMSLKFKPFIYVIGRSSEEQKDLAENLTALRKMNPNVFYFQTDAQDAVSLEQTISQIWQKHGKIDYLLNAAGIQLSQKLVKKEFEEIESELFAKLNPLIHLLQLSKKYPIGAVLNFSSIVALFGNEGQSIYCLANNLIEHYLRKVASSSTGTHFKVIHWPAWDGVGMTANKGVHHILRRTGVALINEEQAYRVFEQEFLDRTNTAVVYLDWDSLPKYDGGLICSNAYEALLPALCTYYPAMSLENINLTDHQYLKGHIFYKTYCPFPASTALTMFLNQSYLHFRQNPIIKNFKALNILNLKPTKTSASLNSTAGTHEIDFSIRTNIVHFQAQTARATPIDLQPLHFQRTNLQEIKFKDIYSSAGYGLEGDFMVMQRIVINSEHELYCECEVSKYSPRTGHKMTDLTSIFIETALQIPGFRHVIIEGNGPFPYQIESLQFFPDAPVTEKVYYITKHKMFSIFESIVDVQMFNADGAVMMAIKNLHIKAEVDNSTFKGSVPMQALQDLDGLI